MSIPGRGRVAYRPLGDDTRVEWRPHLIITKTFCIKCFSHWLGEPILWKRDESVDVGRCLCLNCVVWRLPGDRWRGSFARTTPLWTSPTRSAICHDRHITQSESDAAEVLLQSPAAYSKYPMATATASGARRTSVRWNSGTSSGIDIGDGILNPTSGVGVGAPRRDGARYRKLQTQLYNFLERPRGFRAITYHIFVWVSSLRSISASHLLFRFCWVRRRVPQRAVICPRWFGYALQLNTARQCRSVVRLMGCVGSAFGTALGLVTYRRPRTDTTEPRLSSPVAGFQRIVRGLICLLPT